MKPSFYQVDSYGIVNNIYYAAWFEAGRFAVAEEANLLSEIDSESALSFIVCETSIRYIKPVRFRDSVLIQSTINRVKASKISFKHRILLCSGKILVAEGESAVVVVRNKRLLLNLPGSVSKKIMDYINA